MENAQELEYIPMSDELEKMGLVKPLNRKEKRKNCLKASHILEQLTYVYGSLEKIPEDNRDLHKARVLMGIYDDTFANTDVIHLKSRIARLADAMGMSQFQVMDLIADALQVTANTVKSKIYRNKFTVAERRLVWNEVIYLEESKNIRFYPED